MSWIASWVDGQVASNIAADDRGLAYGDSVFETILLFEGRPVWWPEHLQRLRRGAERLRIDAPAEQCWLHDLQAALAFPAVQGAQRLLLKLILTRGSGGRGYACDPLQPARRIVGLGHAPACVDAARDGLIVHPCSLRLSEQPVLVGIKHGNRLEQVLASQQCADAAADEGLLCDSAGIPRSAIAGNLAWYQDGRWVTPTLQRLGVHGICRGRLLQAALLAEVEPLPDDLQTAAAVVVMNSVRGILPVRQLGDRRFAIQPAVRTLQQQLAELEAAFRYPLPTHC